MSAAALKARMRADLKAAMQARDSNAVRLLRALVAAIDNAEAVPGEGIEDHHNPRALGDPRGEVPRRELSRAELDALLTGEMKDRLAAAEDYRRHGEGAAAMRLEHEAATVASYLSASPVP